MKQTGIVRRIDNLGRIVIPKEIRKALHIHDGEMLEMLVNDENIIIKKYSAIKELKVLVERYVDIFKENIDSCILVTDLDKIIYSTDKKYCGKLIDKKILQVINDRKEYLSVNGEDILSLENLIGVSNYYIYPIISSYDVIGSLIIYSCNNSLSKSDIMLASILVKLIVKSIDE